MPIVTGGIARSILKASVPSLLKRGLGADRSYFLMRELGVRIRRSDFLTIFRTEAGREKRRESVRFVRRDYIPSPGLFSEVGKAMPRNYLYKVRLDVYDAEGNFVDHKYSSVMNDGLLTRGDAEAYASDELAPESEPLEVGYYGNPVLVEVLQSPGL